MDKIREEICEKCGDSEELWRCLKECDGWYNMFLYLWIEVWENVGDDFFG